jgi:anti-sigma-K factor RskA
MSGHPQIPDDVAALISAHALGALEPDQAALAERHIAASDDCRRAYEDALETAAALALAVADS